MTPAQDDDDEDEDDVDEMDTTDVGDDPHQQLCLYHNSLWSIVCVL